MRSKQLPLVKEVPLIAAGLTVVALAAVAATIVVETARLVLHVTGLDRPAVRPRVAH